MWSTLILLGAVAQGESPAPKFLEVPGVQEFTGRLIARPIQDDVLARSAEEQAERSAHHEAAVQILRGVEWIDHRLSTDLYVVKIPEGRKENELAAEWMATGHFEYVEPDWRLFPVGCPNDPLFGNQWHHDTSHLESCAGWDIDTGNPSVAVGICDTGIRTTHQDFALHRLEGYNAVDRLWESQGGQINPVHPHGTMTTGCAAANGNDGKGIAGVGWDLSHRMLRVSNDSGGGAFLSDLQHAAETSVENGDRVASVSYSGVNSSSNRTTATYIKSIGGLLVWAAGNDAAFLNWGNRDADDIIVVGATTISDTQASFSADGPSMDLVAPGESVYTTDADSDTDYANVSGTSFSTPLTAGLCALIWSADPTLTPDEVEDILKAGCDDLGSGGIDDIFGHGRINVFGALNQIGNTNPPLPNSGLLLSFQLDDTLGGIAVQRSDVVHLDPGTGTWSMIFDASDVLPSNYQVNAVGVLPDDSILLSFGDDATSVPGLIGGPNGTLVNDEDLVRFVPTSWGTVTAGTFEFYFDGSDVALDGTKEGISAVSVGTTGNLYISTNGKFDVGGGITGKNEDVLEFVPSSLGSVTAGTWSVIFNGRSDQVKMGRPGEQISAYHLRADFSMLISTGGDFRVPGLSGENDDIVLFVPTLLGNPTEGTFSLFLDGAAYGLDPNNINGLVELN